MNEQLGPELSAAARQLIAEARGADDPSAEDEARVKARWLAGIAAGAGVSSLSEAVRAAASTGWGLKAGALVAALAAATAGVLLGWPKTSGQPHEVSIAPAPRAGAVSVPAVQQPPVVPPVAKPAPAEVSPPAAEVTPPAVEAPVQQSEHAEGRASEVKEARTAPPARSAASARRAAPEHAEKLQEKPAAPPLEQPAAPAAPALSGQLGEEIAALSEIRNDLQAGAATRALDQLSEYRRRFGQPSLAMEADALRVDALCRAGQHEAARAAAAAFASDWPNSPLQQRVSAACP